MSHLQPFKSFFRRGNLKPIILIKTIRLFIFLSAISFLTQCQSPSNQIMEAFSIVDKSIGKSNEGLSNSIDGIYSTINKLRQGNELLAIKADTLYFAAKQANDYMDDLKVIMQLQDTTGIDLEVGEKLLISTPTGDELRKMLLNVYANLKAYSNEDLKENELKDIAQSFQEIQNNDDWAKLYFKKIPTVAAITILKKLQNDCNNTAIYILTDIKDRMTNATTNNNPK